MKALLMKETKTEDAPKIRSASKKAVIIEPVTSLKERVSGAKGGFTFDIAVIKKAERALEELSVNFETWINEEIEQLEVARQNFIKDPSVPEYADTLFQISHDLKGHATTFGYPIIHQFCTSLCRLLENFEDKTRIPQILIHQHVDAVRALVREQVKTTNDQKALKLLGRLRAVTNECIAHELRKQKLKSK